MAGRPPSDSNEFIRDLITFAETREDEHARYEGELEQQVEILHSLFNEIGEIAIAFHDLLAESMKVFPQGPIFTQDRERKVNDLLVHYTEIVGKRNELLKM